METTVEEVLKAPAELDGILSIQSLNIAESYAYIYLDIIIDLIQFVVLSNISISYIYVFCLSIFLRNNTRRVIQS